LFVLGLPLERTVWEPLCTSLSCARTRQSIETDCQWENSPGGIAGVLPAVKARPGSTPGPGDIDVPKAVIAGRDDQPIPVESSRRIAAAISGAQLDVIPHVVV
jgi:pimeloyl-ACP methyl ester carboxylesterase